MDNAHRSTIRRSILVMLILLLASSQALAAVKPTKITVKASKRTIYVCGKTTVKVKSVKPGKASRKVKFKTSNKKVASVSSKGVVTGKKAGKATITVQSKYRSSVKAKVTITVRKKTSTKPEEPELPEVILPEEVAVNELPLSEVCSDIISDFPQYQVVDVRKYEGDRNSYSSRHLVRSVSVPLVDSKGSELDNRVCAADMVNNFSKESSIVVFGGGDAAIEKRAVQLLVSMGFDNSRIYVAAGVSGSEYSKFYVTTVKAPSGMLYNCVSCSVIHNDLDAEAPLYRNLIDLRGGTNDFSVGHLRKSVSVPIINMAADIADNKRRVAKLVEERGSNAIYVVICDRSEDYTDVGTILLKRNGVPDANIVRIEGGLNKYRKYFLGDIVKN